MNQPKEVNNIVILTPSLSGGGAEKVVLLIAKYFCLNGEKVTVIVQDIFYDNSLNTLSFPDNHHKINLLSLPSKSKISELLSLIKIIAECKNSSFLLNLRFVAYAPLIWILQPQANIVVRIGNTLTTELATIQNFLVRLKYFVGSYLGLICCKKIVAQCEYMKKDILAFAPLVKQEKISVIYNAVESDIHNLSILRITDEIAEPYIFCASSYKPQKRLDFLLKSFSLMKDRTNHKLVIAGIHDVHKETLLEVVRNLGLEKRVFLLPLVENIYPLIYRSDLCVLASAYEGFSNFLLEAVSLSKLTLAMDCPGGNSELSAMTNLLLLSKATTPSEFAEDIVSALTLQRENLTMLESELPSIDNMCLHYFELLVT